MILPIVGLHFVLLKKYCFWCNIINNVESWLGVFFMLGMLFFSERPLSLKHLCYLSLTQLKLYCWYNHIVQKLLYSFKANWLWIYLSYPHRLFLLLNQSIQCNTRFDHMLDYFWGFISLCIACSISPIDFFGYIEHIPCWTYCICLLFVAGELSRCLVTSWLVRPGH